MTKIEKLARKIEMLKNMTVENSCTEGEARNAAEMAEAAEFELNFEIANVAEAAELEDFAAMLEADFAAEENKAVLMLTETTKENMMEAEAKAVPSITERAWTLYRAAEVKAGRKFTAADRKGKNSAWGKAMFDAYHEVMKERRIAAVQHLLKPVPEYNYWSLDPEKNSEGRRRQNNAATEHNMRILAEAAERPLDQKQSAEAKALGLSVKEYHNAAKWAKENGMSVTRWIGKLKAEDAVAKGRERMELETWRREQVSAKNKADVSRMRRSGYAARGHR